MAILRWRHQPRRDPARAILHDLTGAGGGIHGESTQQRSNPNEAHRDGETPRDSADRGDRYGATMVSLVRSAPGAIGIHARIACLTTPSTGCRRPISRYPRGHQVAFAPGTIARLRNDIRLDQGVGEGGLDLLRRFPVSSLRLLIVPVDGARGAAAHMGLSRRRHPPAVRRDSSEDDLSAMGDRPRDGAYRPPTSTIATTGCRKARGYGEPVARVRPATSPRRKSGRR